MIASLFSSEVCFSIGVPTIMRCLVLQITKVALIMLFGTGQPGSMTADSQEALEVSGPSHRIGLSGANKRMLHLLKKAKVQLIKIDQQKQLKLSQVRIQDHNSCPKKENRKQERFLRIIKSMLLNLVYMTAHSSKATLILN